MYTYLTQSYIPLPALPSLQTLCIQRLAANPAAFAKFAAAHPRLRGNTAVLRDLWDALRTQPQPIASVPIPWSTVLPCFRALSVLNLSTPMPYIADKVLAQFFHAHKQVEVLNLSGYVGVPEQTLGALTRCPKLTRLSLAHCVFVKDADVTRLSKMVNLTQLSLEGTHTHTAAAAALHHSYLF